MGYFELCLLAMAMAMDCFTVSITCGIIQRRMGRQAWAMALSFGLFQAFMPLLGWLTATLFSRQIEEYDHWVVFGLLAFLGGKMIWDGCHPEEEEPKFNPSSPLVLLTLSVATSIDALAVGFSFVGMGLRTYSAIAVAVTVIGLMSFLFSLLGKNIGVRIGRRFDWPAEQLGGCILIFIGLRVLVEHIWLG